MTQINFYINCDQMTIIDLSNPDYKQTETVDLDTLIIKLKYLMIEKQKAVLSGNLIFMLVLSKLSNDSAN